MNEKRNENNVEKDRRNEISGSEPGENTQSIQSITSGKYEETHFIDTSKPVWNYSLLTDEDVSNFQQGTNYKLYEKFGSHSLQVNNIWGMYFCVWAPNATSVSVKGNFNHWENHEYELQPRWDNSGIWEGFIPHFKLGEKPTWTGKMPIITAAV